jgi:ATP-dependent RNA helicase RhlE
MSEFNQFNLLPSILKAVKAKGYADPSPIQTQCIPHLLKGNDLLGIAQTGTGKTAAFALPLIDRLARNKKEAGRNIIRSLILTPTRELASQIESNIQTYAKGLDLKSKVVFGGVGKEPQIESLVLGLDILVATPGRLLDLMSDGHVKFEDIEVFILDEADSMLDMGFLGDVKKIIEAMPQEKQTLLFSASMPKQIQHLANSILKDPVKVEITPESSVIESVDHKICNIEKANKNYLLMSLLENQDFNSVLLFCKTKFGADRIVEYLDSVGTKADSIHSGKSQTAREEALSKFREGSIRVLVATDVAARGIDVKNVALVVNYNLPEDPRSYVHRIGRTARAGSTGVAISFCTEFEYAYLQNIEKLIKYKVPVDLSQPFHKEFSPEVLKAAKKNSKKKKSYKKDNRRRR